MSSFPDLPADLLNSFFRASEENPERSDVSPSLVLSDWLEDHGDPRAELVRLQCEQSRCTIRDRHWWDLHDRETAWLDRWRDEWLGILPGAVRWERGRFLVEMAAPGLVAGLPEKLQRAVEQGWCRGLAIQAYGDREVEQLVGQQTAERWVVELKLEVCTGKALGLLERLSRLEALAIPSCSRWDLECLPLLRGLRRLRLASMDVSDVLPFVTPLSSLRVLEIHCATVGEKALAGLGFLSELEELSVSAATPGHSGLERLPACPRLRRLDLASCSLGEDALPRLADLVRLEDLSLRNQPGGIPENLVRTLVRLSRLRRLGLSWTRLRGRELVGLPDLIALESLSLAHSQPRPETLELVQLLPGLRELDLRRPWIGPGPDRFGAAASAVPAGPSTCCRGTNPASSAVVAGPVSACNCARRARGGNRSWLLWPDSPRCASWTSRERQRPISSCGIWKT